MLLHVDTSYQLYHSHMLLSTVLFMHYIRSMHYQQ